MIATTNGSAMSGQRDAGAGLSAELVGEVNSVLSKLMSSLNTCDPSLIPLITNLQTSLKATVNKPEGVAKRTDMTAAPVTAATAATAVKKDEALSEFSHNENPYFDNIDEKVKWGHLLMMSHKFNLNLTLFPSIVHFTYHLNYDIKSNDLLTFICIRSFFNVPYHQRY